MRGDEREGLGPTRTRGEGEGEGGPAHRTRGPAGARAGIRERGGTAQVRVGLPPPR